jgi:hypothetical protein
MGPKAINVIKDEIRIFELGYWDKLYFPEDL